MAKEKYVGPSSLSAFLANLKRIFAQRAFSAINFQGVSVNAKSSSDEIEINCENITVDADASTNSVSMSVSNDNVINALGYTPVGNVVVTPGSNINVVGTPSVTASTSGNTTTLTFNYLKGAVGNIGLQGEKGETPVKGVDYWTAEDKTAMVDDVLAALPTWEGGSY